MAKKKPAINADYVQWGKLDAVTRKALKRAPYVWWKHGPLSYSCTKPTWQDDMIYWYPGEAG